MKLSYIRNGEKYHVTVVYDGELLTGIVNEESLNLIKEEKETISRDRVALILGIKSESKQSTVKLIDFIEKLKTVGDEIFEYNDSKIIMKGIPLSIPEQLLRKIVSTEGEERASLIAFWRNLSLCPEPRVRESLFEYMENNGFIITKHGLIVSFRRVWSAEEETTEEVVTTNQDLMTFVSSEYFRLRKAKKGTSRYDVYLNEDTKNYELIHEDIQEIDGCMNYIGNLYDLYHAPQLENAEYKTTKSAVFYAQNTKNTDFTVDGKHHSGRVSYHLLKETRIDRKDADHDPNQTCSEGLHLGTPDYVKKNSWLGDTIMVCLSNPMDAVSVPNDGYCKFRSVAVYPIAIISEEDLASIQPGSFDVLDYDYLNYTVQQIEEKMKTMTFEELKEHRILPFEISHKDISGYLNTLREISKNQFVDMSSK